MHPRFIQTRDYSDPEAYAIAQGLSSVRILATPPRGFHARASQAMLDRVYVASGEASAAVTMVGNVSDVQAFTFATRPAPPRILSGREVGNRIIFRHRPKEVMTGYSPSGTAWPYGTVAFTPDVFDLLTGAFAGRSITPPRDDAMMVQAGGADFTRLLALVADAVRVGQENPEVVAYDAAIRAMSGAVMDALTTCLVQGEVVEDRAAARAHQRIMNRLERVLREKPEEMLSLSDLCLAVGVSERTLHLVCQRFLGIGAMRYVRNRRLDMVHGALLTADPSRARVGDIAMRFGFWELGRFAGAYAARFGERPLATLRRPR